MAGNRGPRQHSAGSPRPRWVGIADLTIIRDEDRVALEVVVTFRCGDAPGHRATLTDWAARVGYRRVWFDGEVSELDPAPGGQAQTRCTGCRTRLVDADASFWGFVRHRGVFPTACILCGSDLPQWTPVRQTNQAPHDPDATDALNDKKRAAPNCPLRGVGAQGPGMRQAPVNAGETFVRSY